MGIDAIEILPGVPAILIASSRTNPPRCVSSARTPPMFTVSLWNRSGRATRSPMKFGAIFFDVGPATAAQPAYRQRPSRTRRRRSQPGQSFPQPPQLFWNAGQPNRLFRTLTVTQRVMTCPGHWLAADVRISITTAIGDLDVVLCEITATLACFAMTPSRAIAGFGSFLPAMVFASTAMRSVRISRLRPGGSSGGDISPRPVDTSARANGR